MKRALVVLLLVLPLPVMAQGYAGVGLGMATADFPDCSLSTTCDDEDTSLKIFGGYRFHENFAIEGGYTDFGESVFSIPGTFDGTLEGSTVFVQAVGIIPINQQFSVFGKAGFHMWEAEESGQIFGSPFSVSDDGTDLVFGFGGEAAFGQFGVRLEWEHYEVDQIDVDVIGVGALIRF